MCCVHKFYCFSELLSEFLRQLYECAIYIELWVPRHTLWKTGLGEGVLSFWRFVLKVSFEVRTELIFKMHITCLFWFKKGFRALNLFGGHMDYIINCKGVFWLCTLWFQWFVLSMKWQKVSSQHLPTPCQTTGMILSMLIQTLRAQSLTPPQNLFSCCQQIGHLSCLLIILLDCSWTSPTEEATGKKSMWWIPEAQK